MSGVRWTEDEYEAWRATKSHNRPAVSAANVESDNPPKSTGQNQIDQVHPRFSISVHHRTRRLADATGRSHKAAVDGIVRGGILRDDSPLYLTKIEEDFEQRENEETIIEVWYVL